MLENTFDFRCNPVVITAVACIEYMRFAWVKEIFIHFGVKFWLNMLSKMRTELHD
jgi:hypothetical protein